MTLASTAAGAFREAWWVLRAQTKSIFSTYCLDTALVHAGSPALSVYTSKSLTVPAPGNMILTACACIVARGMSATVGRGAMQPVKHGKPNTVCTAICDLGSAINRLQGLAVREVLIEAHLASIA